jgi:hypothetical protein
MKKRIKKHPPFIITLSLSIIASQVLFLSACKTGKTRVKRPEFKVIESTLSKGIHDNGTKIVPLDPTTTFSQTDLSAVSFVRLANLSGKHELRWEWFKPDGELYYSTNNTPIKVKKGGYQKETSSWHRILIKGDKAAQYTGEWYVNIYFDEQLIVSSKFYIRETAKDE